MVAAFVYSTVGHGGGSAYLAIMSLVPAVILDPWTMRSTALSLNIVVATAGFINYHRAQHFSIRLLLPFVVSSIPAAFVGGMRLLSPRMFSLVLGATLALSALRFVFLSKAIEPRLHLSNQLLWVWGPIIGAALGFLAGMVGVGGGIFLSPVLLLLGWADAKKTAAVSAAFIVANSISGLIAQTLNHTPHWKMIAPLAAGVLISGITGSRLGAGKMTVVGLQRLLAVVLAVASVKLVVLAFR